MNFLLELLAHRATALEIALVATFAFGWPLGHFLPIDRVANALEDLVRAMDRKLNRARRDVATRAWRGVIATFAIVIPAAALGGWIDAQLAQLPPFGFVLPLALFIITQRKPRILRLWRAGQSDTLTLQLQQLNYLFADTHALLRYAMLEHATRFATGIVGTAFWYLVLGGAGAFGYLALALCAAHYSTGREKNLAFGGATVALFALVDAAPRFLTKLLLIFAGLFAPGAGPRRALHHFSPWPLFVAELLGIAVGGPMPSAAGTLETEWLGSGTPKPDATHLTRWILIWAVALLVLLAAVLPTAIQLKH